MNKFLIDTSSLLALVRYYFPFDNNNLLKDFFIQQFKNNNFILIKEVKEECKRVSQAIVFEALELEKINHTPIKNEILDHKMHKLIDNNFAIQDQKRKLSEEEYATQKKTYTTLADFNLIYFVWLQNKKQKLISEYNYNYTIVTEETPNNNDNKLFKKIPIICKELKMQCIDLPALLGDFKTQINLKF